MAPCTMLNSARSTARPSGGCRCRASRGDTTRVAAVVGRREPIAAAPASKDKLPVLGLISAAIESQARVQQFESFAGRSAMVGFLAALAAEALTEQTVFSALNLEQMYVALGSATASICAAVVLATRTAPPLGAELKEAVITSCTAVQRSAASVTQAQVDKALDYLMERAFSMGTLYTILTEEDLV